jgi:polyphosphate kinase 2 (PPK2 family)
MLESLDLTKTLGSAAYDARLKDVQLRLVLQQRKFVERGIPAVIVFEGMDAAGKGGAIKRLIAKLDPRGYEVHPIGPPDATELKHHHLWRFWNRLPSAGRIGIFDRSWYGRVLVERVERFAAKPQWSRAYEQIDDFERSLVEEGMVLLKFWVHISQDEQLRRFKAREEDPFRRWKITKDDWRNRERWDDYVAAAEEMLAKTSTTYAPWNVVPAESKLHARITILEAVADAFDHAIADEAHYGVAQQNGKAARAATNGRPGASGARSIFEAAD